MLEGHYLCLCMSDTGVVPLDYIKAEPARSGKSCRLCEKIVYELFCKEGSEALVL